MHETLSVNNLAWTIAEKMLNKQAFYGVHASKSTAGATIIDAGVNTPGGFQAGKIFTELCMGGAGKAQLGFKSYGDITLPSITVSTDLLQSGLVLLALWRLSRKMFSKK
jgi:methenyltetrahydromethanopterin cyclohydrolase